MFHFTMNTAHCSLYIAPTQHYTNIVSQFSSKDALNESFWPWSNLKNKNQGQ